MTSDPPPRIGEDPGLAAKVAFLSDPRSYPEQATRVEAVQTHLSWIFLTDRHAWKLKKPARFDHRDLATVEARAAHCRLEIRLNRRLSDGVYLGAVPLAIDPRGTLALAPNGKPPGLVVDWLIRMRRLPAARMLDNLIRAGRLAPGDLRPAVARLAGFYRGCPPAIRSAARWRRRFLEGIADNDRELRLPQAALPPTEITEVSEGQRAAVVRLAARFEHRVSAGRVVEGHGDLRPEHVCLEPRPQFIDCLEFSRPLRILDAAEELGFLALECERLGAPSLRGEILAAYEAVSGDRPPAALVHFFQSYHACVRAKLAVWHLLDPTQGAHPRWSAQAATCLALARSHLAHCA
jgi:aminoglycoside phosphotransferase family enzyme